MRDGMKIGDLALFYHSNGTPEDPAGVYGIAKVVGLPHLDKTALDPKDEHYDPKAVEYVKQGKEPMWVSVDVAFLSKLKHPVSLTEIKKDSALRSMLVAKTGQRLSVMPVEREHFEMVVKMGK